jgi:hypothetical protein
MLRKKHIDLQMLGGRYSCYSFVAVAANDVIVYTMQTIITCTIRTRQNLNLESLLVTHPSRGSLF